MAHEVRDAYLKLRPPDYSEERSGNYLLIWGDLPHWAVVDCELHNLLLKLDGTRTPCSLLATHPEAVREGVISYLQAMVEAGVLLDPEQEVQRPEFDPPMIQNIALNLTRRCNLRCRWCYNLDKPVSSEALSPREIEKVLRASRRLLGEHPSLTILGGEPLLRAGDLLDVAAAGVRCGFTVIVSTNGTRVTEDFARWSHRLGLQVQVSLDGYNAELNDAVRGKGSFEHAMQGIRTLVGNRVHTILSMVCHSGNFQFLENYFDLATSLGADEVRFIPLKRIGGAPGSGFIPVPLKDMLLGAYSLFIRRPDLIRLTGRDAFTIVANTCRFSTRRGSCGTGLQTFLLDSDGSIYPCLNTNLPEFHVANVRDKGFDLERMWEESTVLWNIRRVTSVNEPVQPCSVCSVRQWCLGGCHGETYALTGDLTRLSPSCEDLRAAIIEMLWMLSERPDLVKPAEVIC